MKLKNKTIIVTGSGRGIGRYIAKRLGNEGANVVVTARTEKEIQDVSGEISDAGGSAVFVRGDVRIEEDVKNVIEITLEKFGKIDVLVNNAGVGLRKYLWETQIREFEEVMDVNLKGTFLFMKHIIPEMEKKGGLIINISSGAGKAGIPTLSAYCASKFGVIGLTEAASAEASEKIRIVALCPGSVNAGMFKRLFPGEEADLEPEEVAEKIARICIHPERYRRGASIELY
ncbi:MAG TPA: SDR family oxidoreductase [Candidatus Methanoperedens sp.]|nr:SDR family oxidoreductase [Candidatus Methanoperedens sp.]HLB72233.1 SDR family oxidoreductase [Candidatus Methanoperedens sp.]